MNSEVTQLLSAWHAGDDTARDRLVPVVYGELRRLAGGFMKRERAGHTLQPTALVNEAFVRFFDQRNVPVDGREQFFGLIAQLMRRVLVDHARRRRAAKRGGPETCITLDERLEHATSPDLAVLDVNRALGRDAGEVDDRTAWLAWWFMVIESLRHHERAGDDVIA